MRRERRTGVCDNKWPDGKLFREISQRAVIVWLHQMHWRQARSKREK